MESDGWFVLLLRSNVGWTVALLLERGDVDIDGTTAVVYSDGRVIVGHNLLAQW